MALIKVLDKKIAADNATFRREGIKVTGIPTGKALRIAIDNYVWNNSIDTLTKGGGNPQIRAGVLRLLSTVSEVRVAGSTTDGKPTLTLTAGEVLFDNLTSQVLTIDAKAGFPIKSVSRVPDRAPSSVVTYQVSRVTVADIEAGKF